MAVSKSKLGRYDERFMRDLEQKKRKKKCTVKVRKK